MNITKQLTLQIVSNLKGSALPADPLRGQNVKSKEAEQAKRIKQAG